MIYVWAKNSLKTTIGVHERGFVGAIIWNGGKLYSGGKDGRICITDPSSGTCENVIQVGVLPRAIDVSADQSKLVVGLVTGSIVEFDLASNEATTHMQSHSAGEVWGLDMDANTVYTTGDDNQVKRWDPNSRRCLDTAAVSEHSRKAKKNRASTLSNLPASQQSRAVAVSCNGFVAVAGNDGHVTIRSTDDYHTIQQELTDSGEWIEAMEFSPDGAYLAVGSHDTNIYVYSTADWSKVGTCSKHNASVTCIDWALDNSCIRSVCNAYELLFFAIPSCRQMQDGASATTGTMWASHHCKFGWCVDGIFPKGTDGTHINGVDMNEDQSLIACGDDYGLVQLFRNPCRKGSAPLSFRGHSEHVVRVKFGRGDLNQWLFSVGGYDQTLFQWKRC